MVEDLVGDAVGQGAGLAGAGARDDQEGTGGGRGGVLVGVQAVEDRSGGLRGLRCWCCRRGGRCAGAVELGLVGLGGFWGFRGFRGLF